MNIMRHIVFGTLAFIVTLIIFTIAWIIYIIVSPIQAMNATSRSWKDSLFEVKRRKMESEK